LPLPLPDYLTAADLETPEKFYFNGVFKYAHSSVLSDGYSFGEIGLLTGSVRTAAAICLVNSYVLYCDKRSFVKILKEVEIKKIEKKIELIKNCIGNELPYHTLCSIALGF